MGKVQNFRSSLFILKVLLVFSVMITMSPKGFAGEAMAANPESGQEAAPADFSDYGPYFGILHSHTSYSDGQATPADAYEHAKANGLDFLFVTDHSNMLDGDAFGEYNEAKNEFEEKEGSEWYKTRAFAEDHSSQDFFAGRGFEMTSGATNGGENYGHINVLNTETYVEAVRTMKELTSFYSWIDSKEHGIGLFNHPNRPESSFNYLKYEKELDDKMQLIEIGNGSLRSNYVDSTKEYFKALDYSWHLAPVNSQDNHARNWGDDDNLTGIIAKDLTADSVYEALQNRRVYSTETRNLKLDVLANGHLMGSQLPAGKGDVVHFEITASDDEEKVEEIQIISNGGKVIFSHELPEPQHFISLTHNVTVGAGNNWYVVKVIHEDGRTSLGSAVYSTPAEEDLKIATLSVNPEILSQDDEAEVTIEILNAGTKNLSESFQVELYHDDELIGSHALDGIAASEIKIIQQAVKISAHGDATVRAVLKSGAEGSVKELSKIVNVIKTNGKKIMIDNSHKNIGVVNGTMLQFSEMLRLYGYQVVFNEEPITRELIDGFDAIVLNTPTKDSASEPSNKLTESEEQAIADWVNAGGGLLYATQSTDQSSYNPSQYNTLLEELGSDIRFNHDAIHESSLDNQDNANKQSMYLRNFPETVDGINEDMKAIRIYRGASLVNSDFEALAANPANNLDILLAGNATTYTGTVRENTFVYNSEEELTGEEIPVVARQQIGAGHVIASGRYAYSNYEIGNDSSNAAFILKLINFLSGLELDTTIAELKELEDGETVSIEALVSNEDPTLPMTFAIEDSTGSIAVHGINTGVLPLNENVRLIVNGKISTINGKKVIAYDSYQHQILYIGESSNATDEPDPVQPERSYTFKNVTTNKLVIKKPSVSIALDASSDLKNALLFEGKYAEFHGDGFLENTIVIRPQVSGAIIDFKETHVGKAIIDGPNVSEIRGAENVHLVFINGAKKEDIQFFNK